MSGESGSRAGEPEQGADRGAEDAEGALLPEGEERHVTLPYLEPVDQLVAREPRDCPPRSCLCCCIVIFPPSTVRRSEIEHAPLLTSFSTHLCYSAIFATSQSKYIHFKYL